MFIISDENIVYMAAYYYLGNKVRILCLNNKYKHFNLNIHYRYFNIVSNEK